MAASNSTRNPDKLDEALPEVPDKFAPGELVPVENLRTLYGYNLERLPEEHQNTLRIMVQQVAQMDQFARIDEVMRATEQRFYWRSMFEVYFNSKNMVWEDAGAGAGGTNGDDGDIPLHYSFNIYQQYGKSFIKEVGEIPAVRFIPLRTNDPTAPRISHAADCLRAKIEYQNRCTQLAQRVARLFWTDGRVGFHDRWVTDGALFGYEDQTHVDEAEEGLGEGGTPPKKQPRMPKGGARINAWGVLELKLPINMRDQSDFPFIQLSYEIDLNAAKSLYPHIASTISGGQPGPGEYNFDRTSRIAITQGVRLLTQTGDTIYQLPTYQRTWIRPSFFAGIEDDTEREFFEDNFPDGVMVAFIGETYAESRNESMDDHWDICYPIDSDGQTTPSCGYITMDVQDALLDLTDLQMETFGKAIPAIYGNKDIVDFKAISKEKAGPGAHYPTKRALDGNEKMSDQFWAEPEVQFPQAASGLFAQLLTSIPQGLTNLSASTVGDSDPNNTTKGGILALQDASRRSQGMAWKAFREAYARSMEKLVRIEAYFREAEAEDGMILVSSPEKGETLIDLEDLREGSYFCVPDSDESYPKNETDKRQDLQNLTNLATAGSKAALGIIDANPTWVRQVLGEKDLMIPGADAEDQQMEEIEQMLQQGPIPIPGAMEAWTLANFVSQKMGKGPIPMPPDEKLFRPSVGINKFDNDAAHLNRGKEYLESSEGRRARRENPDGILDIELHLTMHQARLEQAAQSATMQAVAPKLMLEKAKKQVAPKSPSETINYKDAGPSVRLQMEAQAGLDGRADAAADMAAEQSAPPQAPAEDEAAA